MYAGWHQATRPRWSYCAESVNGGTPDPEQVDGAHIGQQAGQLHCLPCFPWSRHGVTEGEDLAVLLAQLFANIDAGSLLPTIFILLDWHY